jgi:membrane protease YdiL (CAAX protease family)
MCSLLFALLHLPSGGMVEAGLLSLAACVLVLKGGALGYALQLHIAWNGFVEVNRMGPASARWFWAGFAASLIVALVLARFRKGGQAPSSVHF